MAAGWWEAVEEGGVAAVDGMHLMSTQASFTPAIIALQNAQASAHGPLPQT